MAHDGRAGGGFDGGTFGTANQRDGGRGAFLGFLGRILERLREQKKKTKPKVSAVAGTMGTTGLGTPTRARAARPSVINTGLASTTSNTLLGV